MAERHRKGLKARWPCWKDVVVFVVIVWVVVVRWEEDYAWVVHWVWIESLLSLEKYWA